MRFDNDEQVETFVFQLAEEVARRLTTIGMLGRSLTLKMLKRDPSAPVEGPKVSALFKRMPVTCKRGLRISSSDMASASRIASK